ncbi:MAG: TonB-dependent receptor, partial [Cyclobacteriaceae bacterium]
NLNNSVRKNNFNNGGRIAEALDRRPTDPIRDKTPAYRDIGNYFIDDTGFNYINPVARTREIVDRDNTNSLFASMRMDYEVIEGLTASAFGSWRKTSRLYENYTSARTTLEGARNIGDIPVNEDGEEDEDFDVNDLPDGRAYKENNHSDEKIYNFILSYDRSFGDHNFKVTGVHEYQIQTYEGNGFRSQGFLVDNPGNLDAMFSGSLDAFSMIDDIISYKNDRKLASFLGRAEYNFNNRYYATVSYRRDGSSVFGANHKWGNFFATSVAWQVSDEGFFQGISFVDNLKLRAGYGEVGNQQGLGALNSLRLARPQGETFFGGTSITNFAITQNENADLKWEVKKQYNVGVDFGLMESKLTGTIDFFSGVTSDLLFDYEVPQPPYPFGTIKANIGEVLNQGIEASFRYILMDSRDLSVTLGGNVSSIRTEVQELNGSLNGLPLETNYVDWGTGGTTGVASTNNAINHLIIGQPLG